MPAAGVRDGHTAMTLDLSGMASFRVSWSLVTPTC